MPLSSSRDAASSRAGIRASRAIVGYILPKPSLRYFRKCSVSLHLVEDPCHGAIPLGIAFLGCHHVRLGIDNRADDLQSMGSLDRRLRGREVRDDRIKSHARSQCEVSEIHGLIAGDRQYVAERIGDWCSPRYDECLVDIALITRPHSDAYSFAGNVGDRFDEQFVLVHRQDGWRAVISNWQAENFGALFGRAHRTNLKIPAPLPLTRHDGLPTWGGQFQGHAQPGYKRFCHIDVEPRELIVGIDESERRIRLHQRIIEHAGALDPVERRSRMSERYARQDERKA